MRLRRVGVDKTLRVMAVALLYVIASPVYVVVFASKAVKFYRGAALMRKGYIDCPHCGETNALDLLATCPKCRTTEYGNRLRCTACGDQSRSFNCDYCGVTIKVL
jgi:phage terminase large subunit GpA-like protein